MVRLEVSTRYLITFNQAKSVSKKMFDDLAAPLHDRMTQCIYTTENLPRKSFNEGLPKDLEPWFVVPLLKEGMAAMERVNNKLGKLSAGLMLPFHQRCVTMYRGKLIYLLTI